MSLPVVQPIGALPVVQPISASVPLQLQPQLQPQSQPQTTINVSPPRSPRYNVPTMPSASTSTSTTLLPIVQPITTNIQPIVQQQPQQQSQQPQIQLQTQSMGQPVVTTVSSVPSMGADPINIVQSSGGQTVFVNHQPAQLLSSSAGSMIIEPNYSDRSFKVSGEATRNYTPSLRNMGGVYNPRLRGGPGWTFSNTRYAEVADFVARANAGQVPIEGTMRSQVGRDIQRQMTLQSQQRTTQPRMTRVVTTPLALPVTSTATVAPGTMQTVSWIVQKPATNMTARVQVGSNAADYLVIQTLVNPATNIVETAIIAPVAQPLAQSRVVIVNGAWQVWGYAPEHTITFF